MAHSKCVQVDRDLHRNVLDKARLTTLEDWLQGVRDIELSKEASQCADVIFVCSLARQEQQAVNAPISSARAIAATPDSTGTYSEGPALAHLYLLCDHSIEENAEQGAACFGGGRRLK